MYNLAMEYVTKRLNDTINVTGIVNIHFFEFQSDFTTLNEKHPFYELVFVNSGVLCINSEDYSGTLSKNEMIVHRPDILHSLSCNSESSPEVIIIGFECNSHRIDAFSKMPLLLGDSNVKKLAEIVKEGRNVFMPPYNVPVYDMRKKRHQLFASEQMLKILLEYFLIKLVREYNFSVNSEEGGGEAPLLINEIIAYVADNYLEKITIDELAFLFKTNRATLCRDFKRNTGKTLIEFVNEKKFEKAKYKILSSTDTFTKIAEELNFESIHYFTRFFKKMSGMTPKDFRKSNSPNHKTYRGR